MASIQTPKTITELLKLTAKHGKHAHFVSGADSIPEKSTGTKQVIDIAEIDGLGEIEKTKERIHIGTGLTLGRLARDASGESGLLRQAASLIANPLVRNRVTLLQALDPESPFFDITTPLMLLDSKIRLQSSAGKRTIPIVDYLEAVEKGLKKGEIPVAVEFEFLPAGERVGFFRIARMNGKGSVSAAARLKLSRGVCSATELVVSSLSLIPLRASRAEEEINGKLASEELIHRTSKIAAEEIQELAESETPYERSLIEIAVGRTLRTILT
jgi:CO/xanthine dehydrogenase FAD-binding subunit